MSERFAFGENWARFLAGVDAGRIARAEEALRQMLGVARLDRLNFLDIGSGSGLSSLAARRLGARVHAFDYDTQSVACTAELRRRYAPDDADWHVEQGSALDPAYLERLGRFDIVYSWGVLHHTGAMWRALELAAERVGPAGLLFIALYNDQGWISGYWHAVKRFYNRLPWLRPLLIGVHAPYLFGARWISRALTGRLRLERGMSLWYDMVDWVGGYPFEVATPDTVVAFFRRRGFTPVKVKTVGRRHGCNEFVFRRPDDLPATPRTAA